MNILVISQYYYPEQFRINDICEELVRRGHVVTVITGIPNYPEGEIYKGYEESYKYEDVHNGVKIIRCHNSPRHKGNISLLINYLSYAREAAKRALAMKKRYDVIYVYQMSPVTMIYPAMKYKEIYNCPMYVYCCDLWPESVREAADGTLRSVYHPMYIVAKMISQKLYARADLIGIKCKYFSDYLSKTCMVKKERTRLLYEHAEEEYLSVSQYSEDNGCYDFMFLGNIGSAQKCESFVLAIKNIETDKPFKLHFVGSGSDLETLRNLVHEEHLDDIVVFHGRHPVSEIKKFYSFADCCVLALSNKTAIGLTPPAKLVGYMAASRPIIAAAEGTTKDIIEDADCGICVPVDDINALSNAMKTAINQSTSFKLKGLNGREYFLEHFTLTNHIDELEKQLKEIIK